MSALVKIEKNKQVLVSALKSNKVLIADRLPSEKMQHDFKENFIELAENDYLVQNVDSKHILTFALNVSKLGININPIYKEAYIVPFNVKDKGMMPTLIMPKQGIRQIAYDAGFFLEIDRVYNMNGKITKQSEMSSEQLVSIKTTDGAWVDENFEGFHISLTDLMESDAKLPVQKSFVGAEYVKKVTNKLQSEDYKIQSWEHKACRRAFSDFFIPRERRNVVLDEVDKLNDSQIIEVQDEPKEPVADVKAVLLEDDAVEADIEEVEITKQTINDYYNKHKETETGDLIAEVLMEDLDWVDYDTGKLTALYDRLKAL